jgi:hypothetical protein
MQCSRDFKCNVASCNKRRGREGGLQPKQAQEENQPVQNQLDKVENRRYIHSSIPPFRRRRVQASTAPPGIQQNVTTMENTISKQHMKQECRLGLLCVA